MKSFPVLTKEETLSSVDISALLTKIMSSPLSSVSSNSPESLHGPHLEAANLEGTNVGASMIVRRSSSSSTGETNDSCAINIYINNNVQGVSNSILAGSQVIMGDPGVLFTQKESKLESGLSNKTRRNADLGFYAMLGAAIVVVFCFMISFI